MAAGAADCRRAREPVRPRPGADRDVDPDAVQRRTVGVLSGGVALGGLGVTVGITVGGLLARDVAGTDSAAGLGTTAGVLGSAVLAVPLARISDRSGPPRRAGGRVRGRRRRGAGHRGRGRASSLPLLLVGLFAFGAATACGLQARYAAADLASPARRGRDLSLVVWATTVGSVLGPNLAGPGRRPRPGAGAAGARRRRSSLSAVAFAVVAAGLLLLLRPDPLLLARRLGGGGDGPRPRRATGAAVRAVWASRAGASGSPRWSCPTR